MQPLHAAVIILAPYLYCMPDLIIVPILLGIFFYCIYRFRFYHTESAGRPWVLIAFLFGAMLGFANYYTWLNIIGHGDSLRYVHDSSLVYSTLFRRPGDYFQLLIGHSHEHVPEHLKYITTQLNIEWHVPEYNMVRLLAFLNIFSFGSVWGNIILLSFISFSATMCLFKLLSAQFELSQFNRRLLFAVLFFIPGFIFWRNGLLKEAPAFILICIILIQLIFLENKYSVRRLIYLLITLFFLWLIRDYVFYLTALNILIWVFIVLIKKLNTRPATVFLAATIILVILALLLPAVNSNLNIASKMKSEQEYFLLGDRDQDYTYSLLEGNSGDLLKKIPYAVNNVLFRPNILHSSDPFRLYAAIESMLIVLFLLYTISRRKGKWKLTPSLWLAVFLCIELLLVYGLMVIDADTISRYRSIPLQILMVCAALNWEKQNTLVK